ncbi:MAG TPA: hypothetical protein VFW62_01245 [bacterium]|nr:hypothetical protein [bacterium]
MATKRKITAASRMQLARDLLWVYEHIDDKTEAPNSGAERLRERCKDNPERFFKLIEKLLPKDAALDKLDQQSDEAAKPHMERLDKLIEEFAKEQGDGKNQ